MTVNHDVPIGHKVALADFAEGDTVIKYGQDIGRVVASAGKGDHIHTQSQNKALVGGSHGNEQQFFGYGVKIIALASVIMSQSCRLMISRTLLEAVANNIKGTMALPHAYGRLQFGEDLELHFPQ